MLKDRPVRVADELPVIAKYPCARSEMAKLGLPTTFDPYLVDK